MLELRQHLWPHTPKADDPAAEVDTWATLLAGYSPGAVVAAMRSLRRPFPPTIGEIEQVLDPWPSPDDVWAEFEWQHARGYSTHRCDNVPWSNGHFLTLAAAGYWRRFGEAPDPHYDEFAGANRANFRKAFVGEVAGALAHERRAMLGISGEGPSISEHAKTLAAALPEMPA